MTTAPSCKNPDGLFRLGAYFALKPLSDVARGPIASSSVIGTFGAQMKTDTFDFGAMVDAVGQMLTQVYGDLAPPWDSATGVYNYHDLAAVDRFHRDFPNLEAKFREYLNYDNVLDEFNGSGDPYVLFNLTGKVQPEAFAKFPDLYKFYRDFAPTLTTAVDVLDENSNYWMRSGFDHGKVRLTFMVRAGGLSAFDAAYRPVGNPVPLAALRHASNRTHSSIRLHRFGMTFGFERLNFINYFTRNESEVTFQARMDGVPVLVAPPGIQQGAEFVAGEFMRTLAYGSGAPGSTGMHSEISSRVFPDGTISFSSAVSAEFMYSPALEFLARLGDSITDRHDAKVRAQERAVAREFLDAFVKDYNSARPQILAFDRDPALTK